MVIRSKTLRFVILISTIIITVIIAIQLIWLQKVYAYEEKQFNINVSKSIRGLYDDMELVNDVSDNAQKEIENRNPDLYLFKIDCNPNLDSLWLNLQAEFGLPNRCWSKAGWKELPNRSWQPVFQDFSRSFKRFGLPNPRPRQGICSGNPHD